MTDTATTTEDLEGMFAELASRIYAGTAAQIAELRAQYGLVTPTAIPATGLIPDVVDGQLIESAWGNAIRDRAVERFDNKAALDAGWGSAANGCYAVTVDTGYRWVRKGGVWQRPPGTVINAQYENGPQVQKNAGLSDLYSATSMGGPFPYPVTVHASAVVWFGVSTVPVSAAPDLVRILDSAVVPGQGGAVTASTAGGWTAVPLAWTWGVPANGQVGYKARINITAGAPAWTQAVLAYHIIAT